MKIPKFLWRAVGVLLVLSFFVPLPFGTLRVAVGLSLLVCSSLPFALFVQSIRRKFEWFNRSMTWMEDKLGERWAGNLMVTRPGNDPRTHFPGSAKSATPPDDGVEKEKS